MGICELPISSSLTHFLNTLPVFFAQLHVYERQCVLCERKKSSFASVIIKVLFGLHPVRCCRRLGLRKHEK